jgi:hypothetical protein
VRRVSAISGRRNPGPRPGVERWMRAPSLLLALPFVCIVAWGCASQSGPTDRPPPEPIQAEAARDGVAVTLAVDRARVAAGGDVVATVSVRNTGPGVVTWQGGGCELQGQFSVTSAKSVPAAPIGHVWDGDKNLIKQLALPEAYAVRLPAPPELAHVDVAFGCTADLAYNELKPGEETHATVVWVASTVAGSPAPVGDYLVAVSFPYVGRDIVNPLMQSLDVKPIVARLVVTVEDYPALPSAGEAMDAVFADAAFTAWLKDHPSRSWDSTAIRYVDGAWVVQVRYPPGRVLAARHDPATGAVTLAEEPAPNPRP